jgi:GT2 family glycosyltransferase
MENLFIPTKSKLVSAVIPTFNSEIDIERLLKSFESLDWPKEYLEIIVVDNNSVDNTINIIQKYFNSWNKLYHSTVLVRNYSNQGAARAYNIGIKNASKESSYIWKLDSDVALTVGSLTALYLEIMQKENIGAVASNQIMPNGSNGNIISLLYWRPRMWVHPIHDYPAESINKINVNNIIGLNGASVLFNKDALFSVNNFDEKYFLYYDDTDIAFAIKKNKYEIRCSKDSIVYHYIKNKEGKNAVKSIYYFLRSQHCFCRKHLGRLDYILYISFQILFFPWIFTRVCNYYKIKSYSLYKKALCAWCSAWKDYAINYYGLYRNNCG